MREAFILSKYIQEYQLHLLRSSFIKAFFTFESQQFNFKHLKKFFIRQGMANLLEAIRPLGERVAFQEASSGFFLGDPTKFTSVPGMQHINVNFNNNVVSCGNATFTSTATVTATTTTKKNNKNQDWDDFLTFLLVLISIHAGLFMIPVL